jgi:hypothetical protein
MSTKPYLKLFTKEELEANSAIAFPADVLESVDDFHTSGFKYSIFECNIAYLIQIKAGTMCGSVGNTAWTKLELFDHLKVRGVLDNDNLTSSVFIEIDSPNEEFLNNIRDLIDEGDGSLRPEYDPIVENWYYFETE